MPMHPLKISSRRRFLSLATLGWSGWIFAFVASFAAIRFYQEASGGPRLIYSVRSVRTIIIDKGRPSDLRAFFDGLEITAPVTAGEVIFWNGGNQAIRADQVLDPVSLRTADGSPILDVQVKSSRAATQLGIQSDKLFNGHAMLTWKFLAPGDAGIVRILYAGGPTTDILMDGLIEGQHGIIRADPPEGTVYRRGFKRSDRRLVEIYAAFILLMSLVTLVMVLVAADNIMPVWASWIVAVIFLLVIGALAYGTWWEYGEPPVGF